MTQETTDSGGAAIVFDDWRTISFAVFMALVGYSVMVTVPVLSTALVQTLSFTEEQVGRVWGNDMLGFSVGAIISALSVARVNRRHLVMAGIVLTIGINALAAMENTMPPITRCRRLTRATDNAAMIAPTEKPSMSFPQTRPTCSSLKLKDCTKAVLNTGTVTITEYPTSAMNTANEIVRQSANMMAAPPLSLVSWVITVLGWLCLRSIFAYRSRP